MPAYEFVCDECEIPFTVTRKMADASDPFECPKCSGPTRRVFFAAPAIWHTEGSHVGDYGRGNFVGTKNEALNRAWSKATGEKPPAPAADVPRNGSEKY